MPVHTSTDKSVTRYVMLMLTYQCNLHCIYCYEHNKSNKSISLLNAKKYIEGIYIETLREKKYQALEIDFSGGEPLIQFNLIKEITEWIWSKKREIPIILFAPTNGTLLNDNMKVWFTKNKDRIALGLSYDGIPSIQDKNRSESSKYVDIDYFLKTWPKQQIKMTVSKLSLGSLADGIIFLHNRGAKEIFSNLAYGISWDQNDLWKFKEQLDILINFYLDHPEIKRSSLLNYDLNNSLTLSNQTKKICGCGTGTVFIDIDGKRYPCQMFSPISMTRKSLENIKNINFSDIDEFIFDECKHCVLRNICPKCYGINYIENLDVSKPSNFLCQSFKIQFLANCKLVELMIKREQINHDASRLREILAIIKMIFK